MVRIQTTNRTSSSATVNLTSKIVSFYSYLKAALSLNKFDLQITNANYFCILFLNIIYTISFFLEKTLFKFLVSKLFKDGPVFFFDFLILLWAPFLFVSCQIFGAIAFYIFKTQDLPRLILLMTLSISHCIFFFWIDFFVKLVMRYFGRSLPIPIGFILGMFLSGYISLQNYPLATSFTNEKDVIIFRCIQMVATFLINIPHLVSE
ncbi:hypothetical protein CDIK_0227 [Cucumispora dikerogammari]|nr:hypothetical protein CDIK_0227 [Cucumispora dikerogammari]